MENKTLTVIIVATLAILVGLALWSTLGDSIGTLAVIQTSANTSYTFPANMSENDVIPCGQLNTSAVVIYAPTGTLLFDYGAGGTGNFTIRQSAGTDGFLTTRLNATDLNATWASAAVNVSCTYQPKGYIAEGGGRAVALLIPILFALLIAIAALIGVNKEAVGNFLNK